MAGVALRRVRKRFAAKDARKDVVAIDDLDLDIGDGELLVLLGPSGCGKTTTLRCIAGLERPDSGVITFGQRTVYDGARRVDTRPSRRDIGMVFQSYALWPHMTVAKNVAYPLRARRVPRADVDHRVTAALELVGCGALAGRLPAQLSGGQQQRVALARALVAEPAVVLFDEPLSNLDARLRDQVRNEVHALHRRLGFTGVYVTHDHSEAIAIADRVVIMCAGRIEQIDRPSEVFLNPTSDYVADFVGFVNSIAVTWTGDRWDADGCAVRGPLSPGVGAACPSAGTRGRLRFRPTGVTLADVGHGDARSVVVEPATVVEATYGGDHVDVTLAAGTSSFVARLSGVDGGGIPARGAEVAVCVRPEQAKLYAIAADEH
jgi:iron(III) transport system ATP-binding protein